MNAEKEFLSLLCRVAGTTLDAVLVSLLALLVLQAAAPGTIELPVPNGPGAASEPVTIEWFGHA